MSAPPPSPAAVCSPARRAAVTEAEASLVLIVRAHSVAGNTAFHWRANAPEMSQPHPSYVFALFAAAAKAPGARHLFLVVILSVAKDLNLRVSAN